MFNEEWTEGTPFDPWNRHGLFGGNMSASAKGAFVDLMVEVLGSDQFQGCDLDDGAMLLIAEAQKVTFILCETHVYLLLPGNPVPLYLDLGEAGDPAWYTHAEYAWSNEHTCRFDPTAMMEHLMEIFGKRPPKSSEEIPPST